MREVTWREQHHTRGRRGVEAEGEGGREIGAPRIVISGQIHSTPRGTEGRDLHEPERQDSEVTPLEAPR